MPYIEVLTVFSPQRVKFNFGRTWISLTSGFN